MNRWTLRWLTGGLALAATGLTAPALETQLGDAAWVEVEVAGETLWAPRPAADQVARLEALQARHPAEVKVAEALADARLLAGDMRGAQRGLEAWARTAEDKARALDLQARWLRARGLGRAAVESLERLAQVLPGEEKAAVYTRLLEVVDELRPEGVDPVRLQRARMEAAPSQEEFLLSWIEAVGRASGEAEALARLREVRADPEVASVAVRERWAALLEATGQADAALAMLRRAADRAGGAEDFRLVVQTLQRRGQAIDTLDDLTATLDEGGLDLAGAWLGFHVVQAGLDRDGDHGSDRAAAFLRAAAEAAGVAGAEPGDHQKRVQRARLARAWLDLDLQEEARVQAYRMYLGASAEGDVGQVAEARRLMLAASDDGRSASGRAPGATLGVRLDDAPGLGTGLASLLYNSESPRASLERLGMALAGNRDSRRRAEWVAAELASGARGHAAVELLEPLADQLSRRDRHLEAADLLLRVAALQDDPRVAASWRLNAARRARRLGAKALGSRLADVEARLRGLLDEARTEGWEDVRRGAFEALERSLKDRGARAEVLALYRAELDAGGGDSRTYQRFLSLLTGWRMHAEAAQVYRRAAETLSGEDWFARAARYLVRRKMHDDLDSLGRQAVQQLSGEDLEGYLRRFASFSSKRPRARDGRLYRVLYEAAAARFPHHLPFVRGLVRYYEADGQGAEAGALRVRYGLRDKDLWAEAMRARVKAGTVDAYLEALGRDGGPVALRLKARALEWRSRFEEAYAARRASLDGRRGTEAELESLARLARSLRDHPRALEAYRELARRDPTDGALLERTGEALMESGDPEGAVEVFTSIADLRPGREREALQAATVLWDYYFADQAREVLEAARVRLAGPDLFARELASVHEARKDPPRAVREWVRAWRKDPYLYEAQQRLRRFHEGGHADAIQAAFDAEVSSGPDPLEALRALGEHLRDIDAPAPRRERALRAALAAAGTPAAARWVRRQAREAGLHAVEQAALERLLTLRQKAPEAWIELAQHLEERRDAEGVARCRGQLVAALDAGLRARRARRVRRYLADEAWRRGAHGESLDHLEAARDLARGRARRSDGLLLAERAAEAGATQRARAIAEASLAESPHDAEWVARLARIPVRAKDAAGVEALYRSALEAARKDAGLVRARREAVLGALRAHQLSDLAEVGAAARVVGVCIDWIQEDPEDPDRVQRAARFARGHGLLETLAGHFQRQRVRSPKDARWHRVAGWIAASGGDTRAAAEAFAAAVAQEPQRVDLRLELAGALRSAGRFAEEAAAYQALRVGAEEGDTRWLPEIAEAQRRAGLADAALATLDAFVQGNGRDRAVARRRLRAGQVLASWGMPREALALLRGVLDTVQTGHLGSWAPGGDALQTFTEAALEVDGVAGVLAELGRRADAVRDLRERAPRENRWALSRLEDRLRSAARDDVTRRVREGGRGADRRALLAALRAEDALGDLNGWSAKSFLRRAGFEQLYLELVEGKNPGGASLWGGDGDLDDTLRHALDTGREDLYRRLLVRRLEGRRRLGERISDARELAASYRRRGDLRGEFEALQRGRPASSPRAFLGNHDHRRLLDGLLRYRGKAAFEAELEAQGLWGINEALRRRDPQLALRLLDGPAAAKGKTWWRRDAALRIGEAFPEAGARARRDGAELLDPRDIGGQVKDPPVPADRLVGAAWFPAAARLARVAARDGATDLARSLAYAEVEGRPLDAAAWLRAATMLQSLGQDDAARAAAAEAERRRPQDPEVRDQVTALLISVGASEAASRRLAQDRSKAEAASGGGRQAWDRLLRLATGPAARARELEALAAHLALRGRAQTVAQARDLLALWWSHQAGPSDPARTSALRAMQAGWKGSRPHLELLARCHGADPSWRLEVFLDALQAAPATAQAARLAEVERALALVEALGVRGAALPAGPRMRLEAIDADLSRRASAAEGDGLRLATLRARLRSALDPEAGQAAARALYQADRGPAASLDSARAAVATLARSGHAAAAAQVRRAWYLAARKRVGDQQPGVLLGLARAELELGNPQAAAQLAEAALRGHADRSAVVLEASRLARQAGRPGASRKALEALLGVDPDDVALLLEQAEVRRAAGDPPAAWLEPVVRVLAGLGASEAERDLAVAQVEVAGPSDADLLAAFGAQGVAAEAAEVFEARGVAAASRGEVEAARSWLARASQQQVTRVSALRRLGDLARRGGDTAGARDAWTQVRRRQVFSDAPGADVARHFLAELEAGAAGEAVRVLDMPWDARSVLTSSAEEADPVSRVLGTLGSASEGGEGGGDYVADEYGYDEGDEHEGDPMGHPVGARSDGPGEGGDLFDQASQALRVPLAGAFPAPPRPPDPLARLQRWLGSVSSARFLRGLTLAREGVDDLDGAREAAGWWQRVEPGPESQQAVKRIEAALDRQRTEKEARVVLAGL